MIDWTSETMLATLEYKPGVPLNNGRTCTE